MKTGTLIFLVLYGVIQPLTGQFTQLEFFSGATKTDVTLLSSIGLNHKNTLQLTTLAFFQRFREEENSVFDEIGLQPTLFWNLHKNVALGPSIYYNSFSGYSERLSARLTLKNKQLLFVALPTLAYSEQKKASYAELFAQVQIQVPVSQKLSFWLNGQFLTVWDEFKIHARSYQQLRLGISLHDHQVGIGLDMDQYGTQPVNKSSLGLYYRRIL